VIIIIAIHSTTVCVCGTPHNTYAVASYYPLGLPGRVCPVVGRGPRATECRIDLHHTSYHLANNLMDRMTSYSGVEHRAGHTAAQDRI
jgi:hypothetical protein